MRYWPPLWHSEDDDNAPLDYSSVSSVNEACRLQQARNMHEKGSSHADMFRKNPAQAGSMSFRRDAAEYLTDTPSAFSRKLRDLSGDAALGRASSEPADSLQDWGIPDNPFAKNQGETPAAEKNQEPEPIPQPQEESSQDRNIPQWLRIARMNNTPDQTANVPTARKRQDAPDDAAHRTAKDYAEAGYPTRLLYHQSEETVDPHVYARRRRGAQLVGDTHSQEAYSRQEGLQADYAKERADRESRQEEETEAASVSPEKVSYAPTVPAVSAGEETRRRRSRSQETSAQPAGRGSSYSRTYTSGNEQNIHQPTILRGDETFFAPQPDEEEGNQPEQEERNPFARPQGGYAPVSRYGGIRNSAGGEYASAGRYGARESTSTTAPMTYAPADRPSSEPAPSLRQTPEGDVYAAPGDTSQMQHYVSLREPEKTEEPAFLRRTYGLNAASAGKENAPVLQEEETDTEEENPEESRPLNLSWIGFVAGAVILAAIVLFIFKMDYEKKTEAVYQARAQAEEAIENNHPFRYQDIITLTAKRYNLQPSFVAAIVLNESSFNPKAESSVGARGLMQLMDDTAEWIHGKLNDGTDYSFDAMYDPETNVEYGCWYLHYLSELFGGDPVLVTAAFHAGQGEIRNWLDDSRYSSDGVTIPLSKMPEGPTRTYTTRVLNDYAAYKQLFD